VDRIRYLYINCDRRWEVLEHSDLSVISSIITSIYTLINRVLIGKFSIEFARCFCFYSFVIRKINDWQFSCFFNAAVMHIHTLSRCVRSFWTSKKSKRSSLVSTISSVKSIVYIVDANLYRHTRIDKQTNKQIIYLHSVSFDSFFFYYVTIESDRQTFAGVADWVHYEEHIPVYTNEMATRRNLRFRIKSRTRQRWWCRTRGVLYAYIKVW
jgi:hypothetical protein